jgi:hypothetical protein
MKNAISKIIELYINKHCKESLDIFYGEGTKIKVKSINESVRNKILLVELIVYLNGEITEDILDTSLVEILLKESSAFFLQGGYKIIPMVTWDVI